MTGAQINGFVFNINVFKIYNKQLDEQADVCMILIQSFRGPKK